MEDINFDDTDMNEFREQHKEEFDEIEKCLDELNYMHKHPIKTKIKDICSNIKNLLTGILCKHDWEDKDHLPDCQSFICTKCGKVKYFDPWKGFHTWR